MSSTRTSHIICILIAIFSRPPADCADNVSIVPSNDCIIFENNTSTFTFNCSGNGQYLLWTVDGYSTGTLYVINKGIQDTHFITSSGVPTVSSQLIVPTTKNNTNITVMCIVHDSNFNPQSSNPVKLILQGILPPPEKFELNISNSTLTLYWLSPPSLEVSTPPTISHYILQTNMTSGIKSFSNPATCSPSSYCNYSLDLRDPFFKNSKDFNAILDYNGTVLFLLFAVNGAGNGNITTCTYDLSKKTGKEFQIEILSTSTIMVSTGIPIVDYNDQTYDLSKISILYGTVCGTLVLLITMTVFTVVTAVVIKYRHKVKKQNIQIEMELNNAYQGITNPMKEENMDQCPAYGVILQKTAYCTKSRISANETLNDRYWEKEH